MVTAFPHSTATAAFPPSPPPSPPCGRFATTTTASTAESIAMDIDTEDNHTIPQQPAGEFHLFSQLPPELRLKIWNLNLPTTRLVSIRCGSKLSSALEPPSTASNTSSPPDPVSGCTSNTAIPVNLHVCAESRAEALESYARCFGFARRPGHVLFNPGTDVLYFGPREGYMAAESQFHTCMTMCDSAELARVRRVAISDALFWIDHTYRSMTAASLTVDIIRQVTKRMPNLEQMLFISREEDGVEVPALVYERMYRQVQTAIHTVCHQHPEWKPPAWGVLDSSSFASFPR